MTEREPRRGGDFVYDALVDAGIDLLVGLPGTQTLPLDRTVVERDEMEYVMARHETAIPHVAWGYNEAGGGVAATVTVPGPGDTNAMHGLKNAYNDCVPIVHVSPDANPAERGMGPIHEIEPDTFDNVVKANVNVEAPVELRETVAAGIESALTPPTGPVRLGVPSNILDAEVDVPAAEVTVESAAYDVAAELDRAAALLEDADRPAVYVGGGARRSPGAVDAIRRLVDDLDAPVVTSYKGKGVFPEDDPHFMGVTASHVPPGAAAALDAADVVLALGTDFDGVTTGHWEVPMGETLIHVNLDPGEFDQSYQADVAIPADVADVVTGLVDRLSADAGGWDGADVGRRVRSEWMGAVEDAGLLEDTAPAYTPAVITRVRDVAPRETVFVTDVGGHRLWSQQVLPVYDPETYVTAGSWAGMGVGLPAAIGARLANPDRPVVCLHGDGGLMMCIHELHTAAEYDLDLTLVVFNNRDYGIISKSPKIREYTEGHQFAWGTPDFATIAEGFGVRGERVESASAAQAAVEASLDRPGTDLVDVHVETDEPSVVDATEFESGLTF